MWARRTAWGVASAKFWGRCYPDARHVKRTPVHTLSNVSRAGRPRFYATACEAGCKPNIPEELLTGNE